MTIRLSCRTKLQLAFFKTVIKYDNKTFSAYGIKIVNLVKFKKIFPKLERLVSGKGLDKWESFTKKTKQCPIKGRWVGGTYARISEFLRKKSLGTLSRILKFVLGFQMACIFLLIKKSQTSTLS